MKKKMFIAASLVLAGINGAKAQRAMIAWSNQTPYTIECSFMGDVSTTCSNMTISASYTMPWLQPPPVPASSLTWLGPVANVINGIQLTYIVGGSPVSSVSMPLCGLPTSPTLLTFPGGGPTVGVTVGMNATTYDIHVD